jgi:hypothetical protein
MTPKGDAVEIDPEINAVRSILYLVAVLILFVVAVLLNCWVEDRRDAAAGRVRRFRRTEE